MTQMTQMFAQLDAARNGPEICGLHLRGVASRGLLQCVLLPPRVAGDNR